MQRQSQHALTLIEEANRLQDKYANTFGTATSESASSVFSRPLIPETGRVGLTIQYSRIHHVHL